MTIDLPANLLCFSHLRWDFVYQRPQHLMTRFSEYSKVYFLEEPIFDSPDKPYISFVQKMSHLWVCVPHLEGGLSAGEVDVIMESLLEAFLEKRDLGEFTFWYYTPMSFTFSKSFKPAMVVYDCMDELSAFKFAPPQIKVMERALLDQADVVFTGGHSLFEAKKSAHYNIHPFPSSIDKEHFQKARLELDEPADQIFIPGPKMGYYGVIDERFDKDLIGSIARERPDWHIILIGPVVKIDPSTLPVAANIHYLGCKSYQELPAYLSGWKVALIPFLLNESTRFISPTKTPEYLAGGKPVVSTAITDVVFPYAKNGLVRIGVQAEDFISAIAEELEIPDRGAWLEAADAFLADKSWEDTFYGMTSLMQASMHGKKAVVLTSELKNAS
jgi:hypothetical protein